ncbi:golgin subfamily A member 6-like protein 2 [Temnothorax curvispinosus]|uniref:Golgin subfamily A member 6-like protein 2 n=1 Tax=Temnothorax curvispinosus TaxID=300111 RepID=A0A6J1PFV6_9HYME|nr:golgin subfamily A member 6-like protein 2 [Temnothorax curvispinosus]
MKEIHDLREDYRMIEMLWEEQKASLENRIKQLEEKVEKMENSGGEKLESRELMKKMKKMERNSELAERRRRKNNIIIKGMKVENGGKRKEKMEKFLEEKITKKKVKVDEVQDIWKEMKEKVKSAITKQKKRIIPWRLGRKEWYNKEWKERKRRLRRLMRDWKKGKIGKEEYVRERKEHKEWCNGIFHYLGDPDSQISSREKMEEI